LVSPRILPNSLIFLSGVVAFEAHKISDHSPHLNDRLVFTQEILDVGGGYDSSTGYYKAPVNGMYRITIQICGNYDKWFVAFIMANDKQVGYASSLGGSVEVTCATGSALAYLKRGQKVWVRCQLVSANGIYDGLDMWNSFSGVLIG